MFRKPVIISLSGLKLTSSEKSILRKYKPWGIILFRRNIKSLKQIQNLIKSIRNLVNDRKYPILIDEEGSSVSRLSKIIKNNYSQKYFGSIYEKNNKAGSSLYENYLESVIHFLKIIGININTVPVLDKLSPLTHRFLKSRCFSNKNKTIDQLGKICLKTYAKNRIGNVIKHIPGHGCSNLDSHKKLPIVNKARKELLKNDFKRFKNNHSHFAMTAHIKYQKLDNRYVATKSKFIIRDIIRKKLGYKGIIISDDLSMKALKGNICDNAILSLEAGCNLVLYCEGNSKISSKLLKNTPNIDKFTQKKTSEFYKFLR